MLVRYRTTAGSACHRSLARGKFKLLSVIGPHMINQNHDRRPKKARERWMMVRGVVVDGDDDNFMCDATFAALAID
jgi:hypothetical protein